MRTVRLVLGDQLSRSLSALSDLDRHTDLVVMAEVVEEATYVRHHKKKIALVFSAMRHFAVSLQADGVTVDYQGLDDAGAVETIDAAVARAVRRHGAERVVVTRPGEYRLWARVAKWEGALGIPVECREDTRFLSSPDEFSHWATGRKSLRMEYFYREMRRRYRILVDAAGDPEGGKWNFDQENRKPPPGGLSPPEPCRVTPNAMTQAVLDLVAERFADNFGDLEPFWYAVTADDAIRAFEHWIETGLASFGDYQDAMVADEDTLFHSVISPYLNLGLLHPLDLVRKAEMAYRRGVAPLNAVEGFIRQILGWREYIRGIYWHLMPDYASHNALQARRSLPNFYWTGETQMACLAHGIDQTRRLAYAHHIQRLMVLGNFALLAGVDPAEVNEWFLVVYADAYQWVELPNVSGMALFADGGIVASKPYAASGKYIDRMSDYCGGCGYSPKNTIGADACPFNALYWHFIDRNRERLGGNHRMAMMYRNWDRRAPEDRAGILARATQILGILDKGERL